MSWNCFLVTAVDLAEPRQVYPDDPEVTTRTAYRLADGREVLFQELLVGAMWESARRGLCVKLPGHPTGVIWAMREQGTDGHSSWVITGTPPNVTATPSINFVGVYHGFVTAGVVTDDCEGRKFDDLGKSI